MNKFTFGIITLSYAPDFERCYLLSESIEHFILTPVTHYIIVDQKDLQLFRQLEKPNTEIMSVESVLPWWIKRIPFTKNMWLSLKGIPIRGWIMQQIVKIAIAHHINKDVLVFVDSDVAFVRYFNLQNFIKKDLVRLFRIPEVDNKPSHFKYHKSTSRLLGLPPMNYVGAAYIGNVISWKRDNILKLCAQLEQISGRSFVQTLGNSLQLSEYLLYGAFVDYFLKEQSGHYYDEQKICHEYWNPLPLSDEDLQKFFAEIHPEHVAVMISAKAGMSVQRYQKLLKLVPEIKG
jgi:Family of unknown function (DUF6492)